MDINAPRAQMEGHVVRTFGDGLLVLGPNHDVHQLDSVAAQVWRAADGTRNVDGLVKSLEDRGLAADRDLVFEALDRLADADLLERRVAPPAGVSRRVLLQRLAGATAVAALSSVVGLPSAARAEETVGQCADDKAIIAEIAWLEAENGAVADYLDEWAEEAANDPETDPLYIEELAAREQTRKKFESSYAAKREDAQTDLADCKLEKKAPTIEARTEQRAKHFASRRERLLKRRNVALESNTKRSTKHVGQEEARKAKLSKNEAAKKKKLLAKGKEEQAQKSSLNSQEKVVKSQERLKFRQSLREQRAKRVESNYEARSKHVAGREEQSNKNLNTRLINVEERMKMRSDAFASKQAEETAKLAGVDDQVLALAQKEALEAQIVAEQKRKLLNSQQEQQQKAKVKAAEQKKKADSAASEDKYKAAGPS